ncbi:MAG: hypothetical protein QOI25_2957, partial [Mycobacterium sp.]|nr:hypothetical protein [Mycobacterium sp.]
FMVPAVLVVRDGTQAHTRTLVRTTDTNYRNVTAETKVTQGITGSAACAWILRTTTKSCSAFRTPRDATLWLGNLISLFGACMTAVPAEDCPLEANKAVAADALALRS